MYVNNIDTLLDMLTQLLAVGGPFDTNKIALFTNDIVPSRTNVLTDFVIANFGGLTNLKAIVWGAPFLNTLQQAEALGGLITWLTTAGTGLPVTAFGYVITNTAGTALILAERFANPFEFSAEGFQMGVVPRVVQDT